MSVRDTVQDKTTKTQEYIRKMAPVDDPLSEVNASGGRNPMRRRKKTTVEEDCAKKPLRRWSRVQDEANLERRNQVVNMVKRNICAKCVLEFPEERHPRNI